VIGRHRVLKQNYCVYPAVQKQNELTIRRFVLFKCVIIIAYSYVLLSYCLFWTLF